jgi:glyoxylase-like metal-dependent hydrolase (beta-lactamase superfamily II)
MVPKTQIHKIRLGLCNAYLIMAKGGAILVDAGQTGFAGVLRGYMARRNIRPEAIRLIVITHVHFDHVGNLQSLKSLCGCPVAVHVAESPLLRMGAVAFPPGTNVFGKVASFVGRRFAPLLKYRPVVPDILISEDLSLDPFGVSGKIIVTPGHTTGSLSVLLPDGTAYVGDLAANHYPGRLGPVLPPFASDVAVLLRSWQHLLDRGAETICPGHGHPFHAEALRSTMQTLWPARFPPAKHCG